MPHFQHCDPSTLKTVSPFSELLPNKESDEQKVRAHMEENGFDPMFPILVGFGPWTDQDLVIDGHVRLKSSIEVGIEKVPVRRLDFKTEQVALEYAIHLQRDRRNLTDADILACVEALDKRKERGGDRRSAKAQKSKAPSGAIEKSAELTADTLGISSRKVERARTVLDHADDETKKAVRADEKTINEAYNETQAKRKEEKNRKAQASDKPTFVRSCEDVKWARWIWDPVTVKCSWDGIELEDCELPNCSNCWGKRPIAKKNPAKLKPTFHSEQLEAPRNTRVSGKSNELSGAKRVLVCPTSDLFGECVPYEWIKQVMEACERSPEWEYVFVTRNPSRLASIDFPIGSFVGVKSYCYEELEAALEVLQAIDDYRVYPYLCVEPLTSLLRVGDFQIPDGAVLMVIVGGYSKTSPAPELMGYDPDDEDFDCPIVPFAELVQVCYRSGVPFYTKSNLDFEAMRWPIGDLDVGDHVFTLLGRYPEL